MTACAHDQQLGVAGGLRDAGVCIRQKQANRAASFEVPGQPG
jgi:hypothetical protein